MTTKVKLFSSTPESRFLCSSKSWLGLTKGMKEKSESWQGRQVRIVSKAKYTEHKTTDALRKKSGAPTAMSVISMRRIHLARRLNRVQPRFITAAIWGQPLAVLNDPQCEPLPPSAWPDLVYDDMLRLQKLTGLEYKKENEEILNLHDLGGPRKDIEGWMNTMKGDDQ